MNIEVSSSSIANLKQIAKEFRPAALRALNKTARMVEVQANRNIRERYKLKRAAVDAAISIRAASISNLTAIITAKGKRFPLFEFGLKQTRKGVPVVIVKGQRKVIRSSFYATMKSGHTGIFKRKDKARLPVKELRTIGVAEMFSSKANREKLIKFFFEKLPEVLAHEVEFFKSQSKKL